MDSLDDFTLGLLTNDEVLDIDQDSLGCQAVPVSEEGNGAEVYAKLLADGSYAVGLFNRGLFPSTVTVKWSDLKLYGSQKVRNLWCQKDMGVFADTFSTCVNAHGVVLQGSRI
jgi:alpha-galactosidase